MSGIYAYCGLQGHGKTYEVVKNVVLPNLLNGRRVVTNIAGLNDEVIFDYLVVKFNADRSRLGSIVHVHNEEVELPYFFPWEDMHQGKPLAFPVRRPFRQPDLIPYVWPKGVEPHSIVQGGDVVVFDEVWRWYASGETLPQGHMTFFRMHRHFMHPETGVTCDVVLIIQVLDDLQAKVKKVVEKNFHMVQHKQLGMPDRYVVNVYGTYRQSKRHLIESHQEKYDSEIFKLYKSNSQSTNKLPTEQGADTRGKLWNRWHFKVGIPLAIVSIVSSFTYMYRFFHPKRKDPVHAAGPAQAASAIATPAAPTVSPVWRVVGAFNSGGAITFVLQDAQNRVRFLVNPPNYKAYASDYELKLPEGDFVTSWSGAAPGASPTRGIK